MVDGGKANDKEHCTTTVQLEKLLDERKKQAALVSQTRVSSVMCITCIMLYDLIQARLFIVYAYDTQEL